MSTKDALLEVTAQLFAEHGWRGTTTRRIAEEAGVNEVTVFRHFGSKAALLAEAIHRQASADPVAHLPAEPGDLRAELETWARAQHRRMRGHRSMIRTCLAEFEEHPEIAPVAAGPAMASMADMVRYFGVARARGLIGPGGSLEAAAVMLMNAIFMDAITRDVVPGCPIPDDEAIGHFVDLVLRALGATELT